MRWWISFVSFLPELMMEGHWRVGEESLGTLICRINRQGNIEHRKGHSEDTNRETKADIVSSLANSLGSSSQGKQQLALPFLDKDGLLTGKCRDMNFFYFFFQPKKKFFDFVIKRLQICLYYYAGKKIGRMSLFLSSLIILNLNSEYEFLLKLDSTNTS